MRDYSSPLTSLISIHALLAESDYITTITICTAWIFLSTLSLRRATALVWCSCGGASISIHALLAESDLFFRRDASKSRYFYPRSPCGERQQFCVYCRQRSAFLSTLSLRRATLGQYSFPVSRHYFYPRSPCGERRNAHIRHRRL